MNNYAIIGVAVMGIVSLIIRALPLTLIRKKITNRFIRSFLYYVPYVTLAAMTFPAMIFATQSVWSGIAALVLGAVLAFCGLGLLPVAISCCGIVLLLELLII